MNDRLLDPLVSCSEWWGVAGHCYFHTMLVSFEIPDLNAIAGWVGAIAGVAALIWQLATWRKSAHNVKVSRTRSWFTYRDGRASDDMVCFAARNVGASAVTVMHWGIALGNDENMVVLDPVFNSTSLPHRLESGAELSLYIHARDLRNATRDRNVKLEAMRGWVGLATGRKAYAKRGVPIGA